MEKITAILKDCKLVDSPLAIRDRQVFNALARAKDDIDEQMAQAQIDYEAYTKVLGNKDADYKYIINRLLESKTIMANGEASLKAIAEIKKDLESTAEIEKGEI